jgi:hypothetical protein
MVLAERREGMDIPAVVLYALHLIHQCGDIPVRRIEGAGEIKVAGAMSQGAKKIRHWVRTLGN